MKINIKDEEKIISALNEVQSKARVRTIDYHDIYITCYHVSARLGISKAAMVGVSFSADVHAQAFPNAYKGIPESTIFSAVYTRSGWAITDIRRDTCRRPTVGCHVTLTDAAKAAIIKQCELFEV